MGFFSWKCKGCNNSILNFYSAPDELDWMTRATALYEDGTIVYGSYDGYGRLQLAGGAVHPLDLEPCIWHRDCWVQKGQPKYDEPSVHAPDQGHFYNEEDYAGAKPGVWQEQADG